MKTIHILLVEDNEGDILLTTEALEEGKIANRITVLKDGKEAIDFLSKNGKYIQVELPDLILLDINLPRKNGHEVLQFIKGSESLKHIPVIMLTTSSSEKDIFYSYKCFASCYITKPFDTDGFVNAVTKIKEFWTDFIKLPETKEDYA